MEVGGGVVAAGEVGRGRGGDGGVEGGRGGVLGAEGDDAGLGLSVLDTRTFYKHQTIGVVGGEVLSRTYVEPREDALVQLGDIPDAPELGVAPELALEEPELGDPASRQQLLLNTGTDRAGGQGAQLQ